MFELTTSDFDGRNNGLDIPRLDMATKSLLSPDISLFQQSEYYLDIEICQWCNNSCRFLEPSLVKYFSSSKTKQHDDLYNKLAYFLAQILCFLCLMFAVFWRFLMFITRNVHF